MGYIYEKLGNMGHALYHYEMLVLLHYVWYFVVSILDIVTCLVGL